MKPTRRMSTPLRTTNQTTESISELQEQIHRRAHELYEQRGRDDGHELDDWLQAESEVTQQKA
jgi:Protein of unknown function (DUF2934)